MRDESCTCITTGVAKATGDFKMLGVDLGDTVAVAVAVDDRGQVLARAEVEAGSDMRTAAVAALDFVAAAGQGSLGVSALTPDSAATLAAIQDAHGKAVHFGVEIVV